MREESGAGVAASHFFPDPREGLRRQIIVHTYRPRAFTAQSPIVLVMHGRNRNGEEYRDWWRGEADRRGFLVAVPEFTEEQYEHPHEYNFAAMVGPDGRLRPRSEWLFPVVEAVFADVRRRFASERERFLLFGHSAGGQLVHRLATFAWSASIERAVAANSGSYTMPLLDVAYPHGLGGTGFVEADLRALLARPLVVLLGESDTDPDHYQLPREPADMAQGAHRFERGLNYFATAQREAARLGVPLAWRVASAPGVAHVAAEMAPYAARQLFEAPSAADYA